MLSIGITKVTIPETCR